MSFRAGAEGRPRWKRQVRATPSDRASGNGSRGETPCAGAGAALAPAQVWAAAQAQPIRPSEFPGGMPRIPRWKRQVPRTARKTASSDGPCAAQGMRPHPASLTLCHLPKKGRAVTASSARVRLCATTRPALSAAPQQNIPQKKLVWPSSAARRSPHQFVIQQDCPSGTGQPCVSVHAARRPVRV